MVRTRSARKKGASRNCKKPKMVGVASASNTRISGSEGKSKACRVKDMNPVTVPQSRISERLRLKKRRKEIQHLDKMIANERLCHEAIPSVTLEIGNPDHQEFFLAQLGLVPTQARKAIVNESSCGRVSIDSYPDSYLVSSDSYNSSDESRLASSAVNSDGEDSYRHYDSEGEWDLELVICPCDIPEFYEEICRKQKKLKISDRSCASSNDSRSSPAIISNGRNKPSPVIPVKNVRRVIEKPKVMPKPQLTVMPQPPVFRSLRNLPSDVKVRPIFPDEAKANRKNNFHESPNLNKPKPFVKSRGKPISSLDSIEDIRMHLLSFQTDLEFVE